jgi:enamine deaminase RidA (YjgF/YER057c/UK114 family)
MLRKSLALLPVLLLAPALAHAQDGIKRTYGSPSAFAQTVTVPVGYETIYLAGVLPDPVTAAADGKPEVFGDTQQQAASAFSKINTILAGQGLGPADVVSMTVYMVGDPAKGAKMDFGGMMRAYGQVYGSPTQTNRPTRSTVQVSALAAPGALLEIEVTAVRKPPAR